MDRRSKRSVLSANGKELRRPCLDRFAVVAKASRNSIEQRRQAGRSAACPFDCAGEICKPRSGVKSSPQPLMVEERPEFARPRGVFELPQRLGLDLPDPLPGYRELLTHFFQRMVGIHPDTETHAQHPFFPRG